MQQINILGTLYTIDYRDKKDDSLLKGDRTGYIDPSANLIVIRNKTEDCELSDYENYKKSVIRHEIIHAYLYESGLNACSLQCEEGWAVNEEMVDWFAVQSPKIFRTFQDLNVL